VEPREEKREEDRSWRKLQSDEVHSLYSSSNIIRVIKPRRMRWAGHVESVGEGRGVYRVLVWRPEVSDHWEDLDVGGRIILGWALRRWGSMGRTRSDWLRIGSSGVLL
jgi:hypothetical protein